MLKTCVFVQRDFSTLMEAKERSRRSVNSVAVNSVDFDTYPERLPGYPIGAFGEVEKTFEWWQRLGHDFLRHLPFATQRYFNGLLARISHAI
jgi:hypothetical protein